MNNNNGKWVSAKPSANITLELPKIGVKNLTSTEKNVENVKKQIPLHTAGNGNSSGSNRIWEVIISGFSCLIRKVKALFNFIFCCGRKTKKEEVSETNTPDKNDTPKPADKKVVDKVLEDVQFYFTQLDGGLGGLNFKEDNILNDLAAYHYELQEGHGLCSDLRKVTINEKQEQVIDSLPKGLVSIRDKFEKKIKANWSDILDAYNKECEKPKKKSLSDVSTYKLRKLSNHFNCLQFYSNKLNCEKPDKSLVEEAEKEIKNRSAHLTKANISGIKNIGNSCYMNASLQTLLAIPAVVTKIEERLQHEIQRLKPEEERLDKEYNRLKSKNQELEKKESELKQEKDRLKKEKKKLKKENEEDKLKPEEKRLQNEKERLKTEIEQLKLEREKLDLEAELYEQDYAKWKLDIDKKEILDALNHLKKCLERDNKDEIEQAAWLVRHKIFYSKLHPEFLEGLTEQQDAAAFIEAILDVIGWDPIKFQYTRGGVNSGREETQLLIPISLPQKGLIKDAEKWLENENNNVQQAEKELKQKKKKFEQKKAQLDKSKENEQQDEEKLKRKEERLKRKEEKLKRKEEKLKRKEEKLKKKKEELKQAENRLEQMKAEVKQETSINTKLEYLVHAEYKEKIADNESMVECKKHVGPPPKNLILHLKRFSSIGEDTNKNKIKIEFPKNGVIDLSKTFNSEAKYRLASCVNHHGSTLEWGHYTAHVRKNGKWYKCDDDRVKEVKENKVPKEKAYVLILEKI